MGLAELCLLAVALGIDCFIVSFSQGLIFKTERIKNSLALALTMGIFQGGMPLGGYLLAGSISSYVETFQHWIVFFIFLILGLKFIWEAFWGEEDGKICCIGLKCLITLGIATSIDAFGAGVSLKFTNANFLLSILMIGGASFIMSLAGFACGNSIKHIPSKYMEICGGLVLIGLAIKAII